MIFKSPRRRIFVKAKSFSRKMQENNYKILKEIDKKALVNKEFKPKIIIRKNSN